MHFTDAELNALHVLLSQGSFPFLKGGDMKMVVILIDKLEAEAKARANPAPSAA